MEKPISERWLSRLDIKREGWKESYERISTNLCTAKKNLQALGRMMDTIQAYRYSWRQTAELRMEIPRFLANLERIEGQAKELHELIVELKAK